MKAEIEGVQVRTNKVPEKFYSDITLFDRITSMVINYNVMNEQVVWLVKYKFLDKFLKELGVEGLPKKLIKVPTGRRNKYGVRLASEGEEEYVLEVGYKDFVEGENKFLCKRRYHVPVTKILRIKRFISDELETSSTEVAQKVFGIVNKRAHASFDDELNIILRYLRDVEGCIWYDKKGGCGWKGTRYGIG